MAKSLEEVALKYAHKSVGKNIHVSLLVVRNKVISWGCNSYIKTSPVASQYGFRFSFIHSELDVLRRFNFRENNIKRASLYNFRFARKDAGLLMACPCINCRRLIDSFEIRRVFYSTPEGMVKL